MARREVIFFTAAVGSELEADDDSELLRSATGANVAQNAVNQTVVWASRAPDESPTVVVAPERVLLLYAAELLAAGPELPPPEAPGLLGTAALDAVLPADALDAAPADDTVELTAVAGVAVPEVEPQPARRRDTPVNAAIKVVRFIAFPLTGADIEFPAAGQVVVEPTLDGTPETYEQTLARQPDNRWLLGTLAIGIGRSRVGTLRSGR